MEHFLSTISKKYNLDKDTILNDWKEFDILQTTYNKMKKPELVEECKSKGYISVGSKPELIVFLLDQVKEVEKKPDLKRKKDCDVQSKPKPNILNKIIANLPTLVIRRNAFGNHEHIDTKFVFDPKNKKVIGKQLEDGNIAVLTKPDIEICHMHKFDFEIPEMLDLTKKDDSTDVMDDDDDIMRGIYDDDSDQSEDSEEEIEYNS